MFSDTPTCTTLVEYDIDVGDSLPVKQCFYHTPPDKREQLEEVKHMIENNIAEPCVSICYSPCLLVNKPDSTNHVQALGR